MSKRSDYFVSQQILLGGQISAKYKRFESARMSPDYAEVYNFLDELPNLLEIKDPIELMKRFALIFGEVDLMRRVTEVTILSMILGNTRTQFSMKDDK